MKRSSGILMPVSSLPSPYGIGTLGKAAYEFVDFLADAGQRWWQMLPVGPTSYGDSPYQSFSTYAGNPYFVDLDMLREDGLLTQEEIDAVYWGSDPARVDYAAIYNGRFALLAKATERGWDRDTEELNAFMEQNRTWLPDYALYMAVKRHFGMRAWTEWEDEDIRLHRPVAVEKYRRELWEDVRLFTYIQFLFFKQWNALRSYARNGGTGHIDRHNPRHMDIVSLVKQLLYQLRSTLAHGHGTESTVTGMAVRTKDHLAAAGQHLSGILMDNGLMRRYIYAAVFLGTGETKHMVIFIDGAAYGTKRIVTVGQHVGHRKFLQA